MTHQIAIIGVSGYSGMELARLVSGHPALRLAAATSDRWRGRKLGEKLRLSPPSAELEVTSMDASSELTGVDVACLATPADVSARVAPALLERGVRIVDLSGAFRLRDAKAYPEWYGFEHPSAALLEEATYGLVGVEACSGNGRGLTSARLVANPGCYATASILALAPLVAAGAIETDAVFIDGKSGVTGAGRKLDERLSFCEVDENVSAYRVACHQHAPEIEQALLRVGGAPVHVTFTPHLLPVRRGLLVTAYGRLRPGVTKESLRASFTGYFEGSSTVDVVPADQVSIAAVARTERACVGLEVDERRRTFVVLGSIDNLLKGAASQALQNLCTMLGLPDPFEASK